MSLPWVAPRGPRGWGLPSLLDAGPKLGRHHPPYDSDAQRLAVTSPPRAVSCVLTGLPGLVLGFCFKQGCSPCVSRQGH